MAYTQIFLSPVNGSFRIYDNSSSYETISWPSGCSLSKTTYNVFKLSLDGTTLTYNLNGKGGTYTLSKALSSATCINFSRGNVADGSVTTTYNIDYIKVTDNDVVERVVTPIEGNVSLVDQSIATWAQNYAFGTTDTTSAANPEGRAETFKPKSLTFEFEGSTDVNVYKFMLSEDSSFTVAKEILTKELSVTLDNLSFNKTYYYKVISADDDGAKYTSDAYTFTTLNTPHTISLDNVSNTRDIAGVALQNSKSILEGMLFRGANLDSASAIAKNKFNNVFRIKTDLDLRGLDERNGVEDSPIGSSTKCINVTAAQYSAIFETSSFASIRQEFAALANSANYPMYFHCAIGRDRTGTMAALLLSLLGASKNEIMKDYEMSYFSYAGSSEVTDCSVKSAVMSTMIDKLYDDYKTSANSLQSSAENFLVNRVGVSLAEISLIKSILLKK